MRVLTDQTNVIRLAPKEHRRTHSMPILAFQHFNLSASATDITICNGNERNEVKMANAESQEADENACSAFVLAGRLPNKTDAFPSAFATPFGPSRRIVSHLSATPLRGNLFRHGTMYDLTQLNDEEDTCSSATTSAAPSAHGSTLHLDIWSPDSPMLKDETRASIRSLDAVEREANDSIMDHSFHRCVCVYGCMYECACV